MNVLVTGSAGRLGRVVVARLQAEGHAVTGVDRRPHALGPREHMHTADLRDPGEVRRFVQGIEAVVHCAALAWEQDPADLASHNLHATVQLVRAAKTSGCTKFIYASTIQVLASEGPRADDTPHVAYLPLDGDSPPRPTNSYAWSKLASEVVIREVLGEAGVQCVIARFPWLTTTDGTGPIARSLRPLDQRENPVVVEQGFSYLTFSDAASLITSCVGQHLPGVRVYLPAICAIAPQWIPHYLERYYAGVPLRSPVSELHSLVALDRVSAETGWCPETTVQAGPPARPRLSRLRGALRRLWP